MLTDQQLIQRLQSTQWRPLGGFFGFDKESPCALMQVAGFRTYLESQKFHSGPINAFLIKTQRMANWCALEGEIIMKYDSCQSQEEWQQEVSALAIKYKVNINQHELLEEVA